MDKGSKSNEDVICGWRPSLTAKAAARIIIICKREGRATSRREEEAMAIGVKVALVSQQQQLCFSRGLNRIKFSRPDVMEILPL